MHQSKRILGDRNSAEQAVRDITAAQAIDNHCTQ